MKKTLTAILCALMAVNLFCSDEKVVLTVLDYQDNNSPIAVSYTDKVWTAFEEAHPDIIIKREVLFNDAFFSRVNSYVAKGKMPDVFFMWPGGRSSAIYDKKLAKDLMPFLEKDGLTDSYNPVVLNPKLQKNGNFYEIPQCVTVSHMTYVNMKVLNDCGIEAPAKTYEELKEQVKILNDNGYEGILMANSDTWVNQSCLFSMIVGRFGGTTWADDIISGKKTFKTGPFLEAVKFLKQMCDDGVISQNTLYTSYGSVVDKFAENKGGYMIDGDWRVGAFITSAYYGTALISPYDQENNIKLINFPAIPGERYPNSNSGSLGVGYGMSSSIPAGSAKEEAAWELIKWLSGPECSEYRFENEGTFPSWTSEGINYDGLEPLVIKRAEFYKNAGLITPIFDSVFEGDMNNKINNLLHDLVRGWTTPEEVCRELQYQLY